MRMGWEQEFDAVATNGGREESSHFKVVIDVEGPERDFMTDVDPIWREIGALAGSTLREHGMRSTAEGVALHVASVVRRHLQDSPDTLSHVRVIQDGVFWVDL